MNYYNPNSLMYPYTNMYSKVGIFSKLLGGLKGIKFSSILSGTQKTLGIVNQTIPLIKQATPIVKNAKTMFKVMNEFKKVDTPKKNTLKKQAENINSDNINVEKKESQINGPTFFL